MRVAHLSDLHLLGEGPVAPWRFLNKRLTGLVNLKYRRHAVHRPQVARALARELAARGVDHVAVTGDLSNLALDREFIAARTFLEDDLGLDPSRVSVVPGNHDVYTVGSARAKRFASYFAPYLEGDLNEFAVDTPAGRFPYVRLRGPIALIGLSSAVPRPPFIAAGELGPAQRDALARALEHPEVRSRYVVVLLHHPPINPPSRLRTLTNGLWDAAALRALLVRPSRVLVLHGHLHRRVHGRLAGGAVDVAGATSASLVADDPDRHAGFNLYDIEDGVLATPRAFVFDGARGSFVERSLPPHLPAAGPSAFAAP